MADSLPDPDCCPFGCPLRVPSPGEVWALPGVNGAGVAPGRVRMEGKPTAVQQEDGSFLVMYHFTLLPES